MEPLPGPAADPYRVGVGGPPALAGVLTQPDVLARTQDGRRLARHLQLVKRKTRSRLIRRFLRRRVARNAA